MASLPLDDADLPLPHIVAARAIRSCFGAGEPVTGRLLRELFEAVTGR